MVLLTLNSLLDRTLRQWAQRTAMIDGSRAMTWEEFGYRVATAAGVLSAAGLVRGDRFALIAHNSVQQAEVLQAGYHLGAVPVPINYRLAAREILAILEDSSSKLILVDQQFYAMFDNSPLAAWKERALLLGDSDAQVPARRFELEMRCCRPVSPCTPADDDDALLLYTAGTTGRSKGVPLSHLNLATNALQIAAALHPREDDIYLHVAPMFHAADLLGNAFLACGAAHQYVAKPTPRQILETIFSQRISTTMLPPTLIILALQELKLATVDLSSLRILVFGSAPMPERMILAARDTLSSTELWHGYGLTETSPILTLSQVPRSPAASEEEQARVRSAGRAVIGTDLRIVDDRGIELPPGVPGEVIVRGPQVTRGYLNQPDETAKQFSDGWFHTGDVGSVDEEGYLYLLDRKKDMVITGGENVYTFEVESVLSQHPDIVEAAVVGVPDEIFGEALVAFIVRRQGANVGTQEIIDHCRKYIGGYKIPRHIMFSNDLPKNALGKTIKADLRQHYAS